MRQLTNYPVFLGNAVEARDLRAIHAAEITAIVDAGLIESYEKYMLERHIPDLLKTGFFGGAKISRSGANRYRIQYEAHDKSSLDEYLTTQAARSRAERISGWLSPSPQSNSHAATRL